MEKRSYLIYVEEIERQGEYNLVCLRDGEIIREKKENSFDDCLIHLYDFQREVFDSEEVDGMVDSWEVKVDLKLC